MALLQKAKSTPRSGGISRRFRLAMIARLLTEWAHACACMTQRTHRDRAHAHAHQRSQARTAHTSTRHISCEPLIQAELEAFETKLLRTRDLSKHSTNDLASHMTKTESTTLIGGVVGVTPTPTPPTPSLLQVSRIDDNILTTNPTPNPELPTSPGGRLLHE